MRSRWARMVLAGMGVTMLLGASGFAQSGATDETKRKVKVSPLARWTEKDVDAYIAENNVLVNPLRYDGYPSIGCWPCTRRVAPGEDPRSGRWAGTGKTECGIHA